jgi:hypothetical protein
MLKLETLQDLQALHTNLVQESSTLEYKASPAVENTDARKQEMAKDISAMANAEGGQFVYGMAEANHQPTGLDGGINPTPYNGLWFEQVIQQNISPQIEGLKILQIPVGNGNVATVVSVPQSKTVHQAKGGRYYRRRNFRNDVMEDYEIREAMYRVTTPDLFLDLSLVDQPDHLVTLPQDDAPTRSLPCLVRVNIGNRSKQPSYYCVVSLFADAHLEGGPPGFRDNGTATTNTGILMTKWVKLFGIPGNFPIFYEMTFSAVDSPWGLTIPSVLIDGQESFVIGYSIVSPGFTVEKFGTMLLAGRRITLTLTG